MIAELYSDIGQLDNAVLNYRLALREETLNSDWRLDLSNALFEAQDIKEALREVRIVLALDPGNRSATQLLKLISDLQATGGASP